jgi:hypothetical protein
MPGHRLETTFRHCSAPYLPGRRNWFPLLDRRYRDRAYFRRITATLQQLRHVPAVHRPARRHTSSPTRPACHEDRRPPHRTAAMAWTHVRVPAAADNTGRDERIIRLSISLEHSGIRRDRSELQSVRSPIDLYPSRPRTALFPQLVSGSTRLEYNIAARANQQRHNVRGSRIGCLLVRNRPESFFWCVPATS